MTHIEAMKQALEYVQEFKSLWWKVPTFADRVNKATREAISFAHNPIFQLEDVLRQAIAEAEKQEPVAWVLLRQDDDGFEPVMFYGGKEKPEGEFKARFTLRPVCFADTIPPQRTEQEPVIDKSAAIRIATALGWEPKREWVGLTNEEMMKCDFDANGQIVSRVNAKLNVQAKLKEKNT